MNNVKIYRNDIDFSLDDIVINSNNFVETARVDYISNFVSVLKKCVFVFKLYENKYIVDQIEFNGVNIYGSKDYLDNLILQSFDIRKSYVATVDKELVNKVINFYNIIEKNTKNTSNKLVFDISKEVLLQKAMNIEPKEVSVESNGEIKKKEKKQGHFSFILLVVVAAVVLTIMSIMIGMKVLGIM